MPPIRVVETPASSHLGRYAASGAFTDCYVAELPFPVSLPQFVEAFYTTPLFKTERLLLALISRSSTDAQVQLVANGQVNAFAAWTVESRSENEVLLAARRTRSWLMVAPLPTGVQLHFGSAVVPARTASG